MSRYPGIRAEGSIKNKHNSLNLNSKYFLTTLLNITLISANMETFSENTNFRMKPVPSEAEIVTTTKLGNLQSFLMRTKIIYYYVYGLTVY